MKCINYGYLLLHVYLYIATMLDNKDFNRSSWATCVQSKIEVPRDVRNSKLRSVDITSSGENDLNIRTNASPKWDRIRCPEE